LLHGLVHLLYAGQARRLFELKDGMVWPDGSWSFSRLLGDDAARLLAVVLCVLAAVGFVVGGVAIFLGQAWWRPVIAGSAAFSAGIFIVFWDGGLRNLDGKGLFAILINAAIIVAVLGFRWPHFGF